MAEGANAPTDFWAKFGDNDSFEEYGELSDTSSLAVKVAETFGLSVNDTIGGCLDNLDIKRMDAMKLIRLSLLEDSATDDAIYEPILNSKGELEFKKIGSYEGFKSEDAYYEIQTQTWKDRCGGVLVIGADPLATRYPVDWKDVWEGGWHEVFDLDVLHSNCGNKDFCQYAAVVFSDPHEDSSYNDGIDNLYEITKENVWDRILGYARFIDAGPNRTPETVIDRTNTARIILPVQNSDGEMVLGTLQDRPTISSEMFSGSPDCFLNEGAYTDYTQGVAIPIPDEYRFESVRETTVDKLMSIDGIYMEGYSITPLRGQPKSHAEAVNPTEDGSGADIEVSIEDTYIQNFRLDMGTHYAIAYESIPGPGGTIIKNPYVVFANNFDITNPAYKLFTNQVVGGIKYNINPYSSVFTKAGIKSETGLIFPTSANAGILVKKIWAEVTLDTPSITIYDPDGMNNTAYKIAQDLKFMIAPLIARDEPAPVAFNGDIIDQTQGITDGDPTTEQNFEDTDIEKAYDDMAGSGMQLTLGFLNEAQCKTLSKALFEYYNSGNGVESVYVCGPNANPELGGTGPNGGIVNSITYSYQDSNSYTISVSCGSIMSSTNGFEQVDTGTNFKKTEDVSGKGVVVQSKGNDIHFKVRVDGVAVRWAINMTDQIIRQGDIVQVTMHNNPVEE